MNKIISSIGWVSILSIICGNALALTTQLSRVGVITVINNSAQIAILGPGPSDPSPVSILPKAKFTRSFAGELFIYRFSKDGLAADSFPFNFDVDAGIQQTLKLTRTSTQMGKNCKLTPALSVVHCGSTANGIPIKPCQLTVTMNSDNTIIFNDGKLNHTATLGNNCQ